MRRRRWWWGLLALVAVAGGLGLLRLRPRDGGDAAAATVPPANGRADKAERPVRLADRAAARNPIETARVERTRLAGDLELVGSVVYDQDHFAIVGPLVPGRVTTLRAAVGDVVRAGQVLAEMDSAEIGLGQAAWLSATARARAAEANATRERELAAQRISSTREAEAAAAAAASEAAEVRAAAHKLRAYGVGEADLVALGRGAGGGGRVALRAPIAGTVVARSITLGQAVERATDAFKIVNLSHLWVLLDVHEKDLGRVHVGQAVELRTDALGAQALQARVAYVHPFLDERTRTAAVRIRFDNPDGTLRPGQFVSARLKGDPRHAGPEVLTVPRRALERSEGKSCVFLRRGDSFERRFVEPGASAGDRTEIVHGLALGDEVAVDGAFLLKSEAAR